MNVVGHDASLSHSAMHHATAVDVYAGKAVPLSPTAASIVPAPPKEFNGPYARLQWIRDQWYAYLASIEERYGPGVLCTEGYAMGAKFHREALGGLGEMMRLRAWDKGWTIIVVAPNTLKKFVTGTGKGDKDGVRMEVLDKWGYKSTDNNDADAYGLMRLGVLWVLHRDHGVSITKDQAAIFKAVTVHSPR